MQITNNPVNIQDLNSFKSHASQEERNTFAKNSLSIAPQTPAVSNEKINMALRAIAFAGKPKGYKEIGPLESFYYKNGKTYELNNGQKVIIVQKPGPTSIITYVKVGSMNEPDDIGGASHFIEHNTFNGARKLKPGQFEEDIEKLGATFNAFTDYIETAYDLSTSSTKKETLEELINKHAEILQYATHTPEMVEKEKPIVIEEIKQYEDDPQTEINDKVLRNLFNIKTEFEGELILGSPENISNLTSEKILDYYNKWYSPDNMTTIIVGNIDPDQTIKLASKYFDKPRADQVDNSTKFYRKLEPIQKTVREDITSINLKASQVNITLAGPRNDDIKETIATSALTVLLSGYKGSKLNKALKPLNTEPHSGLHVISPKLTDPQMLYIEAAFKPGDEEKGLEVIKQIVSDIALNPPSEKEMEIIKNKLTDNVNRVSEYSRGISKLIGEALVKHGNSGYYTDQLDLINNLTPQDLQNVAQKYLNMEKASIVVAHPEIKKSKEIKNSGNISFTGKVKKTPQENTDNSRISEYNLSNNVHLVLNDNPDIIRTSAQIRFSTDNILDIKPGVEEILLTMMEKETLKHSEDELNDITDVNCLYVNPAVGNRLIATNIHCLDKKLPLALDVAKEMILQPSLTQEKFDEAKKEVALILTDRQDTADDRGIEALFADHPWKNTDRAILENIDKVTLEDVKNFYNQIMTDPKVNVVVTGQLSKEGLKDQIINSLQADIPTVKKYNFVDCEKSAPLNGTKVIIEANSKNQADIVQMFKIKETGNIRDNAALRILSIIMNRRLFKDLREKQGLAYTAGCNYVTNYSIGSFSLNIGTTTIGNDNENMPKYKNLHKSIEGFKKHINLLIDKKVSSMELTKAKEFLKDNFNQSIESSQQRTGIIARGLETKYGTNFEKEYLKAIDEVTAEDIQRVTKLYLTQPSVISILANKDTLEKSKDYLKSLGELKEF